MDDKQLEEKLVLLDDLQSKCTNCGICSEGCATFQTSGWEQESPRGRIHLATQFLHGSIHPQSSSALSTFDRCLGCQACEILCPHQVPYHQVRQIVQELRGKITSLPSSLSIKKSDYKKWITVAYRIGSPLWRRYGAKWLRFPSFKGSWKASFIKKSKGTLTGAPILAICCFQDLCQHEVIEQALSFIHRLGYKVEIDRNQPCCGAIFERLIHGGEESIVYRKEHQQAVSYQKKRLNSFLDWLRPNVYFLSKGCQFFMTKQSQQSGDLYAWIEAILSQHQLKLYLNPPREVYYQPYCGLEKDQHDSIWRLLNQIEGLTIHYLPQPYACCGGFCGETLLHPEQSRPLTWQKIASLPSHSTLIITSPDCWGAFKNNQTNKNLNILYPIQLLENSFIKK